MSLPKTRERIQHINHLIKLKATGNAECLAKKLKLSKSGTEKFIREMREVDIPIAYSRKNKSYYYTKDEEFYFALFSGSLTKENIEKIFGGRVKNFF